MLNRKIKFLDSKSFKTLKNTSFGLDRFSEKRVIERYEFQYSKEAFWSI